MTDFRALCGEILQLLDYYIPEDGRPTCWDPWRQRARAARRPKPPSLKEQALDAWDRLRNEAWCEEIDWDLNLVRRALEQLND